MNQQVVFTHTEASTHMINMHVALVHKMAPACFLRHSVLPICLVGRLLVTFGKGLAVLENHMLLLHRTEFLRRIQTHYIELHVFTSQCGTVVGLGSWRLTQVHIPTLLWKSAG